MTKGDHRIHGELRMISAAALCIALSHGDLPEPGRRGGVLFERLNASGRVEFESKIMDGQASGVNTHSLIVNGLSYQ